MSLMLMELLHTNTRDLTYQNHFQAQEYKSTYHAEKTLSSLFYYSYQEKSL